MRVAELLYMAITLYEGIILLHVLATWFASPQSTNPILDWLRRLSEPALEPVRKALPVSGGIDLSPLIVLIGLELLKRLLF